MKIRPIPALNSTQPQTFSGGYEHPWYQYLNRPNPPTSEEIEKAKFIDKTYEWNRDNSVRPGDKRTAR